jgi:hypothetical protein
MRINSPEPSQRAHLPPAPFALSFICSVLNVVIDDNTGGGGGGEDLFVEKSEQRKVGKELLLLGLVGVYRNTGWCQQRIKERIKFLRRSGRRKVFRKAILVSSMITVQSNTTAAATQTNVETK